MDSRVSLTVAQAEDKSREMIENAKSLQTIIDETVAKVNQAVQSTQGTQFMNEFQDLYRDFNNNKVTDVVERVTVIANKITSVARLQEQQSKQNISVN